MKNKGGIGRGGWLPAAVLAVVLPVAASFVPRASLGRAEADLPSEYAIKAAFLYKFLFFVTWPEDDPPGPVVLGILGKDPFGNAFADIENKPCGPGNRILHIRRLGSYRSTLDLGTCHLLFISDPDREEIQGVLERLAGWPVLVISEHPGFLEDGGMVNLVIRDRKVRWEINQAAIQRAGLRIQAQLLRNAVRVLEARGDER